MDLLEIEIKEMSHTGDNWQVDTQYLQIEEYLKFFSISITGREPQEPQIDWQEMTGFDPEASEKQAKKTVERLKSN